ncbi:MAG: hypothetical protein SynsKO_10500 [Synoicihabitans sp.]
MSDVCCLPLSFDGPARPAPLEFEQLRIIITGTPKTGNTWLRHLLAHLYQLPQVDLDPSFHGNDFAGFGRRWIGQQHYLPEAEIVAAGTERGIVFIAPIRHPGDVLISLRHHLQNQGAAAAGEFGSSTLLPESMLEDGTNVFGDRTRRFVAEGFFINLHLSLAWLRGGWAVGVRYEDLWRKPLAAFAELTDRLVPMTATQRRHALSACAIGLMQSNHNPDKKFVRKGGLNSWAETLPPDIKDILCHQAPYPAQFAALGYSMDENHPDNARSLEPVDTGNPFPEAAFANGVAVAAIHMRAYFDQPEDKIEAWTDACAVGAGTFHDWLLQPTVADPERDATIPVITEFAHWLYLLRPDVQKAWPDPFGVDRHQICDWFLFSATEEYGFDRHFGVPIINSWATGRPGL